MNSASTFIGRHLSLAPPRRGILTTVSGVDRQENGTLKFGTTSNLMTDLGNIRKE
ncbi:MAG: hypothetical protein R3C04_07780 [Hyphomonas sp.]